MKKKGVLYLTVRIIWAILSTAGLLWSALPWFYGGFSVYGAVAACFFAANLAACIWWPFLRRLWKSAGRHKAGRIARYLLASVLMLSIVWSVVLSVWMIAAAVRKPDQTNLPLIVLGCRTKGSQPGSMLERRLQAALLYLKENPQAACIVSGGSEEPGVPSEASVMKRWLVAHGIDAERIYAEQKASNTRENLLFAKRIMEQQGLGSKAVLATDGFHQLRSQLMAKRAGMLSYAQSCATRWDLFLPYYIRELFALTRAFLFGY